jgi:hypothetical protein
MVCSTILILSIALDVVVVVVDEHVVALEGSTHTEQERGKLGRIRLDFVHVDRPNTGIVPLTPIVIALR